MAKINIEVGARKAQGAGLGGANIPTGPYKVTYDSDALNDNGNLTIKVKIAEGEHAGVVRTFTAGTDMAKEGNQNRWYTILRSFGYGDTDIPDTLELDTEEMLYGRPGFIFYKAKDPNVPAGEKAYDEVRVITEENYDKLLEEMASRGGEAPEVKASEPAPAEKPKLGAAKPAATLGNGAKAPAAPAAPAASGAGGLRARLAAK